MSGTPKLVVSENSFEQSGSGVLDRFSIDIVEVALRHWKFIAVVGVGGFVLGLLAYLKLGPTYKATSRILVQRRNAALPTDDERNVKVFSDRAEHIALIDSPFIVGKAVERHGLDKLPSLALSDDPVTDIVDNLQIRRSAGSDVSLLNVLDISYVARSKTDAVAIVKAVTDAYREYLASDHQQNINEITVWVEDAKRRIEDTVREKRNAYLDFHRNAPLVWRGDPSPGNAQGRRKTLHQELVEAITAERKLLIPLRAKYRSRKEIILGDQDAGIPRERIESRIQEFIKLDLADNAKGGGKEGAEGGVDGQLVPLIIKQRQLLRDYGRNHPYVEEMRRGIESVLQYYHQRGIRLPQLAAIDPEATATLGAYDVVTAYLSSLDDRIAEIDRRDETLVVQFEEQAEKAREYAEFFIQEEALKQEFETSDFLRGQIAGRLSELQLLKDTSGYTMKVLAPPLIELEMKRPIKFVGAGMFVCLAAALAWICLRDLQDITVRNVDELRTKVGLPVLGGMPTFAHASAHELSASRHGRMHASLCYLHRPGSAEAEAIRSIRTAVLAQVDAQKARVIQVTSAEPADGKTTLLANAAIALAQSGRRVLLIDADLRRPMLHSLFNATPDIGLSDVLSGDVEFVNAIQQTTVAGLSIVTAGQAVASPAELLASAELGRSFRDSTSDYDLVLVDTPPVLAVSDPCVVGRFVDGVLLIVAIGKTPLAHAARANELLESHGIPVLGAIGNGIFDLTTTSGGHGEQYGFETYGHDRTAGAPPASVVPEGVSVR